MNYRVSHWEIILILTLISIKLDNSENRISPYQLKLQPIIKSPCTISTFVFVSVATPRFPQNKIASKSECGSCLILRSVPITQKNNNSRRISLRRGF